MLIAVLMVYGIWVIIMGALISIKFRIILMVKISIIICKAIVTVIIIICVSLMVVIIVIIIYLRWTSILAVRIFISPVY